MPKKKNKIEPLDVMFVTVLIMFCGTICLIIGLAFRPIEYTSTTYQLNELNDGVYAIYYSTYSDVPAHNYEVITLNCNGNVYTFKGYVYISYLTDNANPYVVYEDCDIVYADKISVYVPEGTVEYQNSVKVA